MYCKYKVVEFRGEEWQSFRMKILSQYAVNKKPFLTLERVLSEYNPPCKSVIIEEEYIDKDYLSEFKAFYSSTFKKYSSRCMRLHFFNCALPKRLNNRLGEYKNNYLGFCIIRPTELQRLGRTILKPLIRNASEDYILCKAEYKSHILEYEFLTEGIPFFQQDTKVGACAQAALWMASRYMSHRFSLSEYLPYDITHFAKRSISWGREFPAEDGLTEFQMLEALREKGYSSVIYSRGKVGAITSQVNNLTELNYEDKANLKFAEIIYRYVESCLPVLLCYDDHVIVAMGHTFIPNIQYKVGIQNIHSFIINDDASGPFRYLLVKKEKNCGSIEEIRSAIIIMPPEVVLKGEDAEIGALIALNKLLDFPGSNADTKLKDLISELHPDYKKWLSNLIYRTYLLASTEFKARISNSQLPKEVKNLYIRLLLPKYIWITEISSNELMANANPEQRYKIGEIIVDSTAASTAGCVIAMHLTPLLFAFDRNNTNKYTFKRVALVQPYPIDYR